ncbi:MAG: DNA methyltransferase [Chloroflexota bacterium]|nr:DNA methyltransferase [Chloroflexota bacterium]
MNQVLAFTEYREKERTKHVHRLHPYKGKFIPQLVEYFLDQHTDELKQESWFRPGDLVLDPFCGSGTTLVQAGELGIHAIGIEISEFNTMIANTKVSQPDLLELYATALRLVDLLEASTSKESYLEFDAEVSEALSEYNRKHFPSPSFRKLVSEGQIDEQKYAQCRVHEIKRIWQKYLGKYRLQIQQKSSEDFLSYWFAAPIRKEIDLLRNKVGAIRNESVRNVLTLALTRTLRSCRATTHADLATLKSPVFEPYYCRKHSKICKPLLTARKWWRRYALDSFDRISEYQELRKPSHQVCITSDARTVCLDVEISAVDGKLGELIKRQGVRGIFSSPPYVGLINYHEQHAYAYELLGFARRDENEIGKLSNGQGRAAREEYVDSIAQVLCNCKRNLADNYDAFLVANDKWDLYPCIAEKSGMQIVKRYERPVLFRTEKNRNSPYSETIFHMKAKT